MQFAHHKDNNKRLPEAFYKFDKSIIISFLSGLITSNGKIDNNEIKVELGNGSLADLYPNIELLKEFCEELDKSQHSLKNFFFIIIKIIQ